MKKPVKIILKSGKELSLRRFHPWIFSGAVRSIRGKPAEGDLVEVFSNRDEYLASGHFQPGSIAVRVLTFTGEKIDQEFWNEKIKAAWGLRVKAGFTDHPGTNAYRLVNGEGDFLPGLVVDYYNGTAVIQFHSVGMFCQRMVISEALKTVLGSSLVCIYNKSETSLPFKSGIIPEGEYLWGKPSGDLIRENGNIFRVDWESGQKTGFFLDQRENRKLLAEYSGDRKVLNMFSYTGGFSVYAMKGGAKMVHSVDASKPAVDLACINVDLNFPGDNRHSAYAMDAARFFHQADTEYDLIILDPPAFAKHQRSLGNALQGYKSLNSKAIGMIRPGGIIFTFSCSQAVSRENFRKSVFAAAAGTGRNVRILHQLSQPADHPVNIYHPEGEYLKGLVLRVE